MKRVGWLVGQDIDRVDLAAEELSSADWQQQGITMVEEEGGVAGGGGKGRSKWRREEFGKRKDKEEYIMLFS